ncbi:MAG: hypothetical protein HEQ14_07885 [Aphanizomenon flos-aquae CP01]|jgi:hypothetical protein|nr:hypothetical protein [Aphanizomenon flos-aquae CP01]
MPAAQEFYHSTLYLIRSESTGSQMSGKLPFLRLFYFYAYNTSISIAGKDRKKIVGVKS